MTSVVIGSFIRKWIHVLAYRQTAIVLNYPWRFVTCAQMYAKLWMVMGMVVVVGTGLPRLLCLAIWALFARESTLEEMHIIINKNGHSLFNCEIFFSAFLAAFLFQNYFLCLQYRKYLQYRRWQVQFLILIKELILIYVPTHSNKCCGLSPFC